MQFAELSQEPADDNTILTWSVKNFFLFPNCSLKILNFKSIVDQPLSEEMQSKPQGKQSVTKHESVYVDLDTVLLLRQGITRFSSDTQYLDAWIQGNQK